jgi:hypothetical protein
VCVCVCVCICGWSRNLTNDTAKTRVVLSRHRTKLEIFGHYVDTILQSDIVIMREILNAIMKESYCFETLNFLTVHYSLILKIVLCPQSKQYFVLLIVFITLSNSLAYKIGCYCSGVAEGWFLKTQPQPSFETLKTVQPTTQGHILEDLNLSHFSHHCNLQGDQLITPKNGKNKYLILYIFFLFLTLLNYCSENVMIEACRRNN